MSNMYNIYGDLNVKSATTSYSVSAFTISANTFYGDLDATYVGNNDVNNTEFGYLSGLTGYVQTQLNSKLLGNVPILSLSAGTILTNERVFTVGENLISVDGGANSTYTVSGHIASLKVGVVEDTVSTDQNNYSPTGWNGTYPNKATQILITPTQVVKISGLSGGTSGRIATITNIGNYLIILENESTNSSSGNRFSFSIPFGYFLPPKKSINLIYSTATTYWHQTNHSATLGLDVFERFYAFDSTGAVRQANNTAFYYAQATGTSCTFGFGGYGGAYIRRGTVATNRARIGVVGNNLFETVNGSWILTVGRWGFPTVTTNTGPPTTTNKYATIVGTQNNDLSTAYVTGQLNGGCYWEVDIDINSSFASMVMQVTGNSLQRATSTLPLSSLSAANATVTTGVYSLNYSSATFFWSTNGNTFTIEPPISYTGGTVAGYPGIAIFSQAGTSNTVGIAIFNLGNSFGSL